MINSSIKLLFSLVVGLTFLPKPAWAETINVFGFGSIDIGQWSLATLAVVIGSIDGLNVCSIGALILILSLVLILDSRRQILIYGLTFIAATVVVYGLLIWLWHQIFVFLMPIVSWLSLAIGLLALVGSYYFFCQYLTFKRQGPTCQAGHNRLVAQATSRLRRLFANSKTSSLSLIAGIAVFALVIAIVEFPCSAALPVVFTGLLAQANLPLGLVWWYLGIYLLFYALIEIIVLVIAVITKQIWFTSPIMVRRSTLAGAVLLFGLGLYYLIVLV